MAHLLLEKCAGNVRSFSVEAAPRLLCGAVLHPRYLLLPPTRPNLMPSAKCRLRVQCGTLVPGGPHPAHLRRCWTRRKGRLTQELRSRGPEAGLSKLAPEPALHAGGLKVGMVG